MVNPHSCGDVEFCFFRPAAGGVFLCGDFNGRHPTAFPMADAGGVWWKYRLRLAPGSCQFQYLADRKGYLDYAAFGIMRGPLGVWNSVVLVAGEAGGAEPGPLPAAHTAMPGPPLPAVVAPSFARRLGRRTNKTALPALEACT